MRDFKYLDQMVDYIMASVEYDMHHLTDADKFYVAQRLADACSNIVFDLQAEDGTIDTEPPAPNLFDVLGSITITITPKGTAS